MYQSLQGMTISQMLWNHRWLDLTGMVVSLSLTNAGRLIYCLATAPKTFNCDASFQRLESTAWFLLFKSLECYRKLLLYASLHKLASKSSRVTAVFPRVGSSYMDRPFDEWGHVPHANWITLNMKMYHYAKLFKYRLWSYESSNLPP